jgi:hypothetical protein
MRLPECPVYRSFPLARLAAPAFAALLAACSHHYAEQETDAAATDAAAKPVVAAPAARQKTVFDDQLRALDKAKAVEKQLQEQKEAQDKAIEAEEKGG